MYKWMLILLEKSLSKYFIKFIKNLLLIPFWKNREAKKKLKNRIKLTYMVIHVWKLIIFENTILKIWYATIPENVTIDSIMNWYDTVFDTIIMSFKRLDNCIVIPRFLELRFRGHGWWEFIKLRMFIQCSCLIAPLRGYESALWRMLPPNTGRRVTDWLLRCFIRCGYLHFLTLWSITSSVHQFGGSGYDDMQVCF